MERNEQLLLRVNKAIMSIDPNHPPIIRNPKVHIGMNPTIMTMRSELYYLKKIKLHERRNKMRALQMQDFMQNDKELQEVGLALINNVD